VPVENSTEGVINHTLDRFITSSLKICGEVEIRVHHHLMGHAEKLSDITEVFSHQQSFAQCRQWLDLHLPNVARTTVNSNSAAAKKAAESQDKMAIAGEVAANLYDLTILKKDIEV
jgi:chorismate mutase/prephenate dehydratase